jgi:hypothetical protein
MDELETDQPYCLKCDDYVPAVCADCLECASCCHCDEGPSERQIEAMMDREPYFSNQMHFTDKDHL